MDGYRRSFLANGLAALVLGFSACDAAAGHRRKGSKATTIRRIDKVAYVPSPLLGEELSNPKRTIMVYTFEQLQSAVNQAKPGDHIVLQDESYGTSKLSIGVSGTAQDPIVIRARNVLGAQLPGGFDYAPGTSHVWIWGIDFKDASRCMLRGTNHVLRRCRIWPKPALDHASNGIMPVQGSNCRIDYCELRMHTTSEVLAELGSTDFSIVNYGAIRAYNRNIEDVFRGLVIERCLLTGGLSGLPYKRPNSQFIESDGHPNKFRSMMVDWTIALCYGNVQRDLTVLDFKMPGMRCIQTHIDCPKSARIQIREGKQHTVDRVNFGGVISVAGGPGTFITNSRAKEINIVAGNVPWDNYSAPANHRQAIDTTVVNCFSRLIVGKQYTRNHTYPALDTLIEQHNGSIIYELHRGTTVHSTIQQSRVMPADPITLSAAEVGPFAPWMGTKY